jgi:hypothetical protein
MISEWPLSAHITTSRAQNSTVRSLSGIRAMSKKANSLNISQRPCDKVAVFIWNLSTDVVSLNLPPHQTNLSLSSGSEDPGAGGFSQPPLFSWKLRSYQRSFETGGRPSGDDFFEMVDMARALEKVSPEPPSQEKPGSPSHL